MYELRYVCAVVFAFVLLGCSQEASVPPQPAEPVAKVREGVSEVVQGAAKVVEGVRDSAGEVVEKVAEGASSAKQEAVEEVKEVVEKTGSTASQVVGAVGDAAQEVKAEIVSALKSPGVVTYEASKGKVTFRHADHGRRHACTECHSSDPPQKITFAGMAEAHALCRDCHKKLGGAAPTACNGCHKP